MEQKLISLLRVLAATESQIDNSRAILTKSSKEALKIVDPTGRNILSSFEISQFLEKHKIKLEQDEIRMIVQYYDINRKGKLDLESFQKALTPRNKDLAPSSLKSLEENLVDFFVKELDLIRKTQTLRVQLFEAAQAAKADAFKLIDTENNGEITLEELESFLKSKGARLSCDETKAIFQRGDRNAKGLITLQDFEAFIAPDVTKKKVIAKQPDLSIKTEVEVKKPVYSQSAKHASQGPVLHNYGGMPETTVNRGYPQDNYSYQSRPIQSPVTNGQLAIQELREKYDAKNSDYASGHSTYQAYNPSYQAQNPSYQAQNPSYQAHNPSYQAPVSSYSDRLDYNAPQHGYERSHSPSRYENKTYEGSYGNTASSYPNSQPPQYSGTRSYSFYHKDPNQFTSTTYADNTTASRYGASTSYGYERSRNMNKSMSISALHSPVSKSSTYDRGYQDYPSTSYGHREPLSNSHHYQGTYERSRYEHSPYRSRDYSDYRPGSSLSPSRYETRQAYDRSSPRDHSYQAHYEPSYKRREGFGNDRSLYNSTYVPTGYEGRDYRGYERSDHGMYGSDMMRRSGVAAPQNQALMDWGRTSGYAQSPVNRQGTSLYDRNQLQEKYNSLSRTINMYA